MSRAPRSNMPVMVMAAAALLALAGLIAPGATKGDWWIPAAFAAIPAAGIVYALKLAGTLPEAPSR